MKNIIIINYLLLLIILISCKKETVNNINENENLMKTSQNSIRISAGHLCFDNKADYINTINWLSTANESNVDAFEQNLGFQSMKSLLTESQRDSIGIDDEILASLLNADGVIQIENYIFRINTLNENVTVYSLSPVTEQIIDTIFFSINDNILDILYNDSTVNTRGSCPANKQKITNWSVSGGNVECKVVYQKAGIYFSLQSKIKKEFYGGTTNISLNCPSGSTYTKNINNANLVAIPSYGNGGTNHVYHYRPYSSFRGLKQYHFLIEFYCTDYYYGTNYATSLCINCN